MQCSQGLRPEREYRFHPTRRWRFDFAYPAQLVAVEFEGGTFRRGGGAHSGAAFVKDCEKYNAAAELGWLVLRYTDKAVRDGSAIDQIVRVIEGSQA